MTFDHEFVHRASLINVAWHPHKLFGDKLDLRYWQNNLVECLKCNREVVAVRASDGTLELAMHQINNDGLRPFEVGLPRLNACPLIILAVGLQHGHEGLHFYSVQIFV